MKKQRSKLCYITCHSSSITSSGTQLERTMKSYVHDNFNNTLVSLDDKQKLLDNLLSEKTRLLSLHPLWKDKTVKVSFYNINGWITIGNETAAYIQKCDEVIFD